MKEFDKIANEAIKKGAILSNLFFDHKSDNEEDLKKQLSTLFKKISKEQGVIYTLGIIDTPIKEEYPDEVKFMTSGEIRVLTKDLTSIIRIVGLYGPTHIEVTKPDKIKISPKDFEENINQSVLITYKLSQHIVRSSFTSEQKIEKGLYIKNNTFREKLVPLIKEKNYSIENVFENLDILNNYYEKGKYIATFSFNIHDFSEEGVEKRLSDMVNRITKLKTVLDVKELKDTEFDIVEHITPEHKYYSTVKHIVIVCDDVNTLFILGFMLGSFHVKLNLLSSINLNLNEFQESLNELSQVVFELTSHIIKNKLFEGM